MKVGTKFITKFLMYLFMILVFIVSVYPFYAMVINATSSNSEIFSSIPRFIPSSHLIENFNGIASTIPIWTNLLNSVFVAVSSTVLIVFICGFSGFAFAKFEFKGRDALFVVVMVMMMIPGQITLVPLFILMTKLGWIDTYKAVILPGLGSAFGVFLMRQNMMSFPNELMDAYRIDGCNDFMAFFKIVLPTMTPAVAVLSILTFMGQWGNFIWPMIVLNTADKYTLPVALRTLVAPGEVVEYGHIMVGTLISVIPVVAIFLRFQKFFIAGLMGGAVKG